MLRIASLLLVLAASSVNTSNAQDCDRCNFDGNDAVDCKDYGLIDNSVLVAWDVASEECLDTFQIVISSPDPTLICASTNSFVNELRFGSSLTTAKLGLGVAEGGFFDDAGLKDTITIDGQTYDCDASESDCYNAMKPYFGTGGAGAKEMDDVCSTLQNAVFKDRQVEQSTVRNRLCQESRLGVTIPTTCEPLWDQLQKKMQEYPEKNCPGFAFGTQNMVIPGCTGSDNGGGSNGGTGSSSPSEGIGRSRLWSCLMGLSLLLPIIL